MPTKRDLVDCLHEHRLDIHPVNILCKYVGEVIETARSFEFSKPLEIIRVFKGLGECEDLILEPNNLDSMDDYYLVHYKANQDGLKWSQRDWIC